MKQVLLIIGFGCFCLGFVIVANYIIDRKPIPFESQIWKNANTLKTSYSSNPRPGMARDLINRNLLEGKTPQEVVVLLGETEYKYQSTFSYITEEEYYVIEPVRTEFLDVIFNAENKVEKLKISVVKHR